MDKIILEGYLVDVHTIERITGHGPDVVSGVVLESNTVGIAIEESNHDVRFFPWSAVLEVFIDLAT